ncbi:hypothetical protein STENM223S_04070 [Streptomyces tendae]
MREETGGSVADRLAPVLRPVRAGNGFEEALEQILQVVRLGLVAEGERLPAERELAEPRGLPGTAVPTGRPRNNPGQPDRPRHTAVRRPRTIGSNRRTQTVGNRPGGPRRVNRTGGPDNQTEPASPDNRTVPASPHTADEAALFAQSDRTGGLAQSDRTGGPGPPRRGA